MLSLFNNRSFLVRFALEAVALALMFIVPTAAYAAAGTANVLDFTSVGSALSDVQGFLTGPLAKFVAILSIVIGAIMFVQGREMSEGLKIFGVIAVACGMMIGAASFFKGTGAII